MVPLSDLPRKDIRTFTNALGLMHMMFGNMVPRSVSSKRLSGLTIVILVVGAATSCDRAAEGTNIRVAKNGTSENADLGDVSAGFVLSNIGTFGSGPQDTAMACSEGLNTTDRDNWLVQFPTPRARLAHLDRCGSFHNRGPHCENVWFTPDAVRDPLPFHGVTGEVAYGGNLDGTRDGAATLHSCAHQKFRGPTGETGIDNQFYRFFGCMNGFRGDAAAIDINTRKSVRQYLINRLLLEVTQLPGAPSGVVDVAMYHGRDPLQVDVTGHAIPYQTQRVDDGALGLMFRVRGHLTADTLVTDAADVYWVDQAPLLIRGMTLRLTLDRGGAKGFRLGYMDIEQLWASFLTQTGASLSELIGASGPSAYVALHNFADGYRDKRTGSCTALSSATDIEFVRARLRHNFARGGS